MLCHDCKANLDIVRESMTPGNMQLHQETLQGLVWSVPTKAPKQAPLPGDLAQVLELQLAGCEPAWLPSLQSLRIP